jgi:hypothetical protein
VEGIKKEGLGVRVREKRISLIFSFIVLQSASSSFIKFNKKIFRKLKIPNIPRVNRRGQQEAF